MQRVEGLKEQLPGMNYLAHLLMELEKCSVSFFSSFLIQIFCFKCKY